MDITNNKVLTFEQCCNYLGYAKSYVYKLTSAGILPIASQTVKSIFFDREKLEAWMLGNANISYEQKQIEAHILVCIFIMNNNGERCSCNTLFKKLSKIHSTPYKKKLLLIVRNFKEQDLIRVFGKGL